MSTIATIAALINRHWSAVMLTLIAALSALALYITWHAGFAAGARDAYQRAEHIAASLRGQIAQLRTDSATQMALAERRTRERLEAEMQRANAAEVRLIDTQRKFASERQTLQQRIKHVSTQYIAVPGEPARAAPRCVFTRGWLRDYNAAIGAPDNGLPATDASASPGAGDAAPTAAANADTWLLESGVSPADVLAHVIDYGERCRSIEEQLTAAQALLR